MKGTYYGGQKNHSGLSVAALVIGIIALVLSWVPIVNNISALLGLVGLILGIVAFVKVRKTDTKKGFYLAGIILNIVAMVAVGATQTMYAAALDKAVDGTGAVSAAEPSSEQKEAKSEDSAKTENQSFENLALGTPVTLDNGLVLTVTSVEKDVKFKYMDGSYTKVALTIENTSKEKEDFNSYNWRAEDSKGVETNTDFVTDDSAMTSGNLAPGGKFEGVIYFKGDDFQKVSYVTGLNDTTAASWKLS